MSFRSSLGRFHDLPVHHPLPALDRDQPLPPADSAAFRVAVGWGAEYTFEEAWLRFLDAVDTTRVRAVVIGAWWNDGYDPLGPALDVIVRTADRLPALRALFLGDVDAEECEISWLEMCDITPLFEAFGQLEELVVRGGSRLTLKPVRHEHLRSLRFESGGLPAELVRGLGGSDLPALERLDLWLGVEEYGGDHRIADLAPFLDGSRLPALRHLGLQNSEYQDEIAAAVAQAPVMARLSTLALGMGTLTDEGAAALLEGQPLTHLAGLDLHHHYLTEPLQRRLRDALPGVDLDLSEPEEPDEDDWRYTAVAE